MTEVRISDTIEISFKVGDSLLSINGDSVEVETPYVVEGVTLVPIRVITEAFGAEVDWIEATEEIVLKYQDVEITLQIANINAYVNGQEQKLLYPPQLNNEKTMVPLRFITETFGADVKYDEATQQITVTKAVLGEMIDSIEDVLQKSNKPMVGDSYYNWSLNRSSDMELEFRTFDGRRTCFAFNLDDSMEVNFYDRTNDDNVETLKVRELEFAKSYTLTSQKVLKTKGGSEYISTQFRDKDNYVDRRAFIRPNDQIVIVSLVASLSTDAAKRDEYTTILDSFDFNVVAADTEDLSDVVNDMRLFDQKDFGVELRLPANWRDESNPNRVNAFHFAKYDSDGVPEGTLSLIIYSKESGDTVTEWASRDLSRNKRVTNPERHSFSELRTMTVGTATATYYESEDSFVSVEFIGQDIFWEYEGYFYNLHVEVRKNNQEIINSIIKSVKYDKIDFDKVGILHMDKLSDDEDSVVSTIKNTALKFTINVPTAWINQDNSIFADNKKGLGVSVTLLDKKVTLSDVGAIATDMETGFDAKLTKRVATIDKSALSSNAYSGYTFELFLSPENEAAGYFVNYTINAGNKCYLIMAYIPEQFYSEASKETAARIVKSFVAN